MSAETINEKLKLYANTYVKGECRSKEYEAQIKREKRLNQKIDLADTMFNEVAFPFTPGQKAHVETLIRTFPNFKELNKKATNEEIILAFIFYVKALSDKRNIIGSLEGQKTIRALIPKVENQMLFQNTFEIVSWNITLYYVLRTPILPTEPQHIDHNLLYKGNIK